MRFALALAIVLSASTAIGETSQPEVFVTPPNQLSPLPADEAVAPLQIEKAQQQVCVEIGQNSLVIHYGKEAANMAKQGPAQSMLVICDKVTATSGKGEASTLACENCKFTMPNGVTGEAASIAFDSSSGLLSLSGSDENPVKLTMTNGGTFSITAKAEIALDAKTLGGATPVLTTIGSRY